MRHTQKIANLTPRRDRAPRLIEGMKKAIRSDARLLDLRHDCLASPNNLDAGIVSAAMLWPAPDDEAQRRRYLLMVEAECYADMDDPNPVPVPSTVAETKHVAYAVRNAPRVDQFTKDAKKRFVHGYAAGFRLWRAVDCTEAGKAKRKMRSADEDFCTRLTGTVQIRPKTIDNKVWPEFKCVSHLWAAWIDQPDFKARFLIAPVQLGNFLDRAERYRRLGETTNAPRSGTILTPGEAIAVPHEIILPSAAT